MDYFHKEVIQGELGREIDQGFHSIRVTADFRGDVVLRRRLRGCGGDPSIHVEGIIGHKWLFVK
jgi:hypothetical protein